MLLVILGVVAVLLVLLVVVGFNRLRRADVAAREALGGIDVQLTRRADLVPNLVATVQGYAAHERTLLEELTAARTRVRQAAGGDDVGARAVADAALERSLVHLDAVAEGYPELTSSANFLDLQRQLSDAEREVAFARQYYNDAVRRLNELVTTIPWMFFAGVAGVSRRDFYEAPRDDRDVPTVQF